MYQHLVLETQARGKPHLLPPRQDEALDLPGPQVFQVPVQCKIHLSMPQPQLLEQKVRLLLTMGDASKTYILTFKTPVRKIIK